MFGSEKRSNQMPVPVSCIVAAHSSLWVGTENGVILSYPFSLPSMVSEETGWEVIKVVTTKIHVHVLYIEIYYYLIGHRSIQKPVII